jgi:hypothetical protein
MRRLTLALCVSAVACAGLVASACIGDAPQVTTKDDADAPDSTPRDGSVDASDDRGSDAPFDAGQDAADAGPSFTPASFGGRLALWLDATKGIAFGASGVATWQDQSSNHNDAHQPVAASQPILVPGTADGGVNGKPVVYFGGTASMTIDDSLSLQWATDDFVVSIVLGYTNAVDGDGGPASGWSYADVFVKTNPVNPYPGIQFFANYPVPPSYAVAPRYEVGVDFDHGVLSSADGKNDGQSRVVTLRRRGGTTVELRVGGAVDATNADAGIDGGAIDVSAVGSVASIGAHPAGIAFLRGEIAEIVGLHGAISDGEVGQLESYLKTKYGL